jgi:hypothetical protein
MSSAIFDILKQRVEQRYYTISDIMNFKMKLSGSYPKDKDAKHFLKSELDSRLKNVLSLGELPHLDPDFAEYSTDGAIDDQKLLEYLDKNCYYKIQQLDVRSNYVELSVSLKKIYLNFVELSEQDLEKIFYVKIKSFMGEFEIGEDET